MFPDSKDAPMSALETKPWTLAEFFAWQDLQDERYELVGGFPLRMQAGATQRHDAIVLNVLAELRNRLRGKRCQPFTADGSVETFPGQIRRPDAGVDCGPREPDGYHATEPTVIVEVLSRTTRRFDKMGKLQEYKGLPTLRHLVVLDSREAMATHWRRDADGSWREIPVRGILGAIELDAVDVVLLMNDLYDGVSFD
jgi:Uma2 family endonuclease